MLIDEKLNVEDMSIESEAYKKSKEKFEEVFENLGKYIYFKDVENDKNNHIVSIINMCLEIKNHINNYHVSYTYMDYLKGILKNLYKADYYISKSVKSKEYISNILNQKIDDDTKRFMYQYYHYCTFYIMSGMLRTRRNLRHFYNPIILGYDKITISPILQDIPNYFPDKDQNSQIIIGRFLSRLMIIDYMSEREENNYFIRSLNNLGSYIFNLGKDRMPVYDTFLLFLMGVNNKPEEYEGYKKDNYTKNINLFLDTLINPTIHEARSKRTMEEATPWYVYLLNAQHRGKGLYMSDLINILRYSHINEAINHSNEEFQIAGSPVYNFLEDIDKSYKESKYFIKEEDRLIISYETVDKFMNLFNKFDQVDKYYYNLDLINMKKINDMYGINDVYLDYFEAYINEYFERISNKTNSVIDSFINNMNIKDSYLEMLDHNIKLNKMLLEAKMNPNLNSYDILKNVYMSEEAIGMKISEAVKDMVARLLMGNTIDNQYRYTFLKEHRKGNEIKNNLKINSKNIENYFNYAKYNKIFDLSNKLDQFDKDIKIASKVINKISELAYLSNFYYYNIVNEFHFRFKNVSHDVYEELISIKNDDIRRIYNARKKVVTNTIEEECLLDKFIYDLYNLDFWRKVLAYTRVNPTLSSNFDKDSGTTMQDKLDENDYISFMNNKYFYTKPKLIVYINNEEELRLFSGIASALITSMSVFNENSILDVNNYYKNNMIPLSNRGKVEKVTGIYSDSESSKVRSMSHIYRYVENINMDLLAILDSNLGSYRKINEYELNKYFRDIPLIKESKEILKEKLDMEYSLSDLSDIL